MYNGHAETHISTDKENNASKQGTKDTSLLHTTLWLTGLPCSGKTTLAKRLKERLESPGFRVMHLDADEIRRGLSADLGFSLEDRRENIRRVAHVAKLFNDNGNFVITSFVSPTDELRTMARDIIGNFILVFVKCNLNTCEMRDTKGMYKKARSGQIKEFTGVSSPFEEPSRADIIIDTEHNSIEDCVKELMQKIGVF